MDHNPRSCAPAKTITQLNQRLDLLELRMFVTPSISPRNYSTSTTPLFCLGGYVEVVKASLNQPAGALA